MDGHFVPNITFGAPVVASLRKRTSAYLDCHLMVTEPWQWVDAFAAAGASGFTFHLEVVSEGELSASLFSASLCPPPAAGSTHCSAPLSHTPGPHHPHPHCRPRGCAERLPSLVASIVAKGMRAGICIKPGTPVEGLVAALRACPSVALALVMTVEPGFGGQAFQPAMLTKVAALRAAFPALDIQVDGGVDCATVGAAAAAGANVIVSGTGIFRAAQGAEGAIAALRQAVLAAQAAAAAAGSGSGSAA
jgi:ribulose-phosphate 3-epimerase